MAATIAALLSLPAGTQAATHPGQLDPTFGRSGKAAIAFPAQSGGDLGVKYDLPFEFDPGYLEMAAAPDGKIVVSGSTKVVRLLPNGRLDPSFGSGGSVALERPAGKLFAFSGVAVDSQGRVLIAGSVRPLPTASTPDPLISSALVRRLTPGGAPDTGFGEGGTLISDLGIEPPMIGTERYKGASVGLRSIAVDSADRPVLTGGFVAEVKPCPSTETAISTAFVARLTEAGSLDTGFGEGGLRSISNLSSFGQGKVLPSGSIFAVGSGGTICEGSSGPRVVLTGVGSGGLLDPGFGFAGFRSLGYLQVPIAAVTPSGRILLLGRPKRGGTGISRQLVIRLLPDGALDPSFGRTGRVVVTGPRNVSAAAIAADGRDRVLLAGHISRPVSKKPGPSRSSFLLSRLKRKGTFDRTFGKRGSVRTGFGGPASSFATQVLLDQGGRILVGGLVTTPRLGTGGGFALARYIAS
jgi:uncharacterized delta-60 repeat protein